MKVLSLFDGISCGQMALAKVGLAPETYYASEINPKSIQITQANFPDTVQLGDVTQVSGRGLGKIDLLMGGSPCEDLSITQSHRADRHHGLEGTKSKLFYEFVRILTEVKPTYFLLENVASMTPNTRDTITDCLGVAPILIDSALLSAQSRKRLYWTNIPNIQQPYDEGLVLQDIMEPEVDERYYYNRPYEFHGLDKRVCATIQLNTDEMNRRVYNPAFKCATLTAIQGGYHEKKVWDNGRIRKLTPVEYERLQTLPDGYTCGVSDTARRSACGDGWTVDVIVHILEYTEVSAWS